MQVNSSNTISVRVQNVLNEGHLLDVGGAFVVDHNIVAIRPIGSFVHWQSSGIRRVHHMRKDDRDMGTLFQPLLEYLFLTPIIMTASARDE
jgi:hypothetical protein